jgi:hypothetical protein
MKPPRSRRIRWWLRTGVLLSVIGVQRFARTAARTRWQPIFLVTGALFVVIGLTLRSSVAFLSGMLAMGSALSGTGLPSPTAAMVRTWTWLKSDHQS